MTKLQLIVAEIEALEPDERRELVSLVINLNTDDFFELTDSELAEFDKRKLNAENESTLTSEEVFTSLREKYVQSDLA